MAPDAAALVPDHTWKLKDNNNNSRLGLRGSQDLGVGDLKGIYQLEYSVDPDGSEGTPFSERDIFVGLQGGFGHGQVRQVQHAGQEPCCQG